ncbi:MFS transporter [Anaerostipes faecis]|uniref:MFS transporter n=1 Tax=Anaerostipes faecis TaxID=2880702 RepID=UPI0011DCB058|nr:MFS transporter [Anaerostipes faecis]
MNIKKRNTMMVFGAFAILFTGYPHVWSIYQPYVMKAAGWSTGQVSFCFYLPTMFFVLGNILGGRLQDKKGPTPAMFIGGGILTAGVLVSRYMLLPSPIWMYLTFGVMQGIGSGMIYAPILSTAQKWFPGRTGFASGVVITANGICGLLMAPVSKTLLEAGGPRLAFLAVGLLIGVSWILGTLFIRKPEETAEEKMPVSYGETRQYTSAEMVKTRKFYYLLCTMMCGLMAYYLTSPLSQTLQTDRGISAALAVGSVMAGSILNAGMRLVLPSLSDKIGRIQCIKGVILLSMAAMVFLITGQKILTTLAVILIYGCFGGIMGSFPSLVSSIFGLRHSGQNYGIVMFGIIVVTALSPCITNLIAAGQYPVNTTFLIGFVFSAAAFLFLTRLEKEIKNEKQENGKQGLEPQIKLQLK